MQQISQNLLFLYLVLLCTACSSPKLYFFHATQCLPFLYLLCFYNVCSLLLNYISFTLQSAYFLFTYYSSIPFAFFSLTIFFHILQYFPLLNLLLYRLLSFPLLLFLSCHGSSSGATSSCGERSGCSFHKGQQVRGMKQHNTRLQQHLFSRANEERYIQPHLRPDSCCWCENNHTLMTSLRYVTRQMK